MNHSIKTQERSDPETPLVPPEGEGWRAVSFSTEGNQLLVLWERETPTERVDPAAALDGYK